MKKIYNLTDAQIDRFGEWSKKWIAIGLSTEPADFDAATEAALKAYQLCNFNKPTVVLRVDSPYAATVGGAYAWVLLKTLFKNQVGDQIGDQVRNQVWDQVGAQVWNQVVAQVRNQCFETVKEGVYNDGISSNWAGFAAFATFFRDVCGCGDAQILERLAVNEALVKSCGWTWWHQNILVISDMPKAINRDVNGRLHCETGASIAYRDGWSLYHWHGISIPSEWVTGKKPTAKEALTYKNIEQRRAAAEIVGWHNILHELNAKIIDEDQDPQVGILLEADIPDSGKEKFLKVRCETGREFVLPIPREVKTALEANLWTYGLDADRIYLPEVRT